MKHQIQYIATLPLKYSMKGLPIKKDTIYPVGNIIKDMKHLRIKVVINSLSFLILLYEFHLLIITLSYHSVLFYKHSHFIGRGTIKVSWFPNSGNGFLDIICMMMVMGQGPSLLTFLKLKIL